MNLKKRLWSLAAKIGGRILRRLGVEVDVIETPTSAALRSAYQRAYKIERDLLLERLRILSLRAEIGISQIAREIKQKRKAGGR